MKGEAQSRRERARASRAIAKEEKQNHHKTPKKEQDSVTFLAKVKTLLLSSKQMAARAYARAPEIDYVGQGLANKIAHMVFCIGWLGSVLIGAFSGSILRMWQSVCVVMVLACFLVLPPWSMYRKNPIFQE